MVTEINLALNGAAFKAQFGTEERIEMLAQILRNVAECPIGEPFLPRVQAMNIVHTQGEMIDALKRLDETDQTQLVHQLMRYIVLKDRADQTPSMYEVQQNRISKAAEVMGYMSMALEHARDTLKNGMAKDGVKAALSRYRQWCDGVLQPNPKKE